MKKKLGCILLLTVLIGAMCFAPMEAQACNPQDVDFSSDLFDGQAEEIQQYIEPDAPAYLCATCKWTCFSMCNRDETIYQRGSHKTLFGLGEECKIIWYRCTGMLVCINCSRVWERYDYHDCRELHGTCSKGNYIVCPMEYYGSQSVGDEVQ